MEMTTIWKHYVVVVVGFSTSVEAPVSQHQFATCYGNFWVQLLCSFGTFHPSLAAFISNLGVGKPHPVGSTLTLVGSLDLKPVSILNCTRIQVVCRISGIWLSDGH